MQRIVLTGGPGAGKTTTLAKLREQGFQTGEDAARTIIRTRKRAGLSPRPDALTFAQQVFAKELEAYDAATRSPAFFERGIVDAVALLLGAGGLNEAELDRLLTAYPYQAVFIFPPWEEIYCVDDERDHTFEHSVHVHETTLTLYRRYDYQPIEVPPDTADNRANFILDHLPGV